MGFQWWDDATDAPGANAKGYTLNVHLNANDISLNNIAESFAKAKCIVDDPGGRVAPGKFLEIAIFQTPGAFAAGVC